MAFWTIMELTISDKDISFENIFHSLYDEKANFYKQLFHIIKLSCRKNIYKVSYFSSIIKYPIVRLKKFIYCINVA